MKIYTAVILDWYGEISSAETPQKKKLEFLQKPSILLSQDTIIIVNKIIKEDNNINS